MILSKTINKQKSIKSDSVKLKVVSMHRNMQIQHQMQGTQKKQQQHGCIIGHSKREELHPQKAKEKDMKDSV